MDLLIKDLELPKNYAYRLTVYPNGHVEEHTDYSGHGHYQAIEIPPGRLVDAYKLRTAIEDDIEATAKKGVSVDGAELWKILNRNLEFSPAVLEAST